MTVEFAEEHKEEIIEEIKEFVNEFVDAFNDRKDKNLSMFGYLLVDDDMDFIHEFRQSAEFDIDGYHEVIVLEGEPRDELKYDFMDEQEIYVSYLRFKDECEDEDEDED